METEVDQHKTSTAKKGRRLSNRAHTGGTRAGSWRGSVGPLPFWPPAPLPHHPQLQHILPSCQTFALCVQSNSLFLQKKTNKQRGGGRRGGVGVGVTWSEGSEFLESRLFTWLAACSSSFPSPTTTYVMLVPKRETIRSKQLSLPGDKQTGFDRVFGVCGSNKVQEKERLCVSLCVCTKGEKKPQKPTHNRLTQLMWYFYSHKRNRSARSQLRT